MPFLVLITDRKKTSHYAKLRLTCTFTPRVSLHGRSLPTSLRSFSAYRIFRSMISDESSDSYTSLDTDDDLQQSEDDCPLHDRIDNHGLAGLEDRKLVYMWTWPCGWMKQPKIMAAYRAANSGTSMWPHNLPSVCGGKASKQDFAKANMV